MPDAPAQPSVESRPPSTRTNAPLREGDGVMRLPPRFAPLREGGSAKRRGENATPRWRVAIAALRRLLRRLRKRETPAQRLGRWGERLAARHLRRKGYRIVGRRIRPGPRAEIDIVALGRDRGGPFIAFVEVKTRAGDDFGGPVAALDDEKRRSLRRAARLYLRRLSGAPVRHRFDLVAVVGSPDSREKPVVQHFENAFRFDDAVQAQWL